MALVEKNKQQNMRRGEEENKQKQPNKQLLFVLKPHVCPVTCQFCNVKKANLLNISMNIYVKKDPPVQYQQQS